MSAPSPPDSEAARELEEALRALGALAGTKRQPTRYHARAVMLPLGRILLEGGGKSARQPLERLAELVAPFQEAWERAVREELALACAEHTQGVDPRHLDDSRFDFEYVVTARERLEARLAVATALDLSPAEETLDRVAAADRLLAPHLRRRSEPS